MDSKTVWANVLLSDGKILFWYIGSECDSALDFYKDFYYADIEMLDYCAKHHVELQKIGFVDTTKDQLWNRIIFEELAQTFFRQWEISEDSRGTRAY